MAHDEPDAEHGIASGRPAWTPVGLLGYVIGAVSVLFAVALLLVALAYVLA